ncbi:hypothetical protein WJX73_009626 [Symbiochloris irregularis]|uniref:Uncharacterized protein n=1 Tax=Symbiochloris irregularis TaxID=706552 RepID=A0AAW1NUR3_9CHLO
MSLLDVLNGFLQAPVALWKNMPEAAWHHMHLDTKALLIARQVCRDWRLHASLQINELCVNTGDFSNSCLALLQNLTSLRSLFFQSKDPLMLCRLEAVTRLTRLGLPASADHGFDAASGL